MPRIFISVAEPSADMHAAALVRRARERMPGAQFYGLAGPRLRAAGVVALEDFTAGAAMLTGVFARVGRGWRVVRRVQRSWRERPPDAVVLMDSGTLHLPMARRAKRIGLPVLYYIAPQTWASRAYRNRTLARCVDELACILPFEQDYFRRAGVRATYVGHPLFESLDDAPPPPTARETAQPGAHSDPPAAAARSERSDAADAAIARSEPPAAAAADSRIALLPGSRGHVIETMLPLQLAVVRSLAARGFRMRCAISAADDARAAQIRAIVQRLLPSGEAGARGHDPGRGHPLAEILVDDNAAVLTGADLVLVASGTATLHVASYRKPMIVMYDAGRALRRPYQALGRYVVTTPHLSLVNLLAGRRVVPEFMPFVHDVEAVASVADALLRDERWRRLIVRQLDELVAPLERTRASDAVCDILERLVSRDQRRP